MLASSAIMDVTRHVGLVIRRGSQIGSAGSESVIVTAGVLIASVVIVSGELLEVGVQFLFVPPLASLLDQEECDANNDGNTDQAHDGEGGAHGRLVLQESGNEISASIEIEDMFKKTDELPDPLSV